MKPEECTHLIVKTLARTEKFLCAIAVAPTVVTEKWVRDSIAAKKLLRGSSVFSSLLFSHSYPEYAHTFFFFFFFFCAATNNYVLADPANEKKWQFKLADALKRAKANKGHLFAGKVFYVTNKVPLDKKLLKNIVLAHGGQVSERAVLFPLPNH